LRKEGRFKDLPIAVEVLQFIGTDSDRRVGTILFLGELSLGWNLCGQWRGVSDRGGVAGIIRD
jgi:predicted ATPase with chaperone activity